MGGLEKDDPVPVKRPTSAGVYEGTRDVEVAFLSTARIEMGPCVGRVEDDGLVLLANVVIEVIFTVDGMYDGDGVWVSAEAKYVTTAPTNS